MLTDYLPGFGDPSLRPRVVSVDLDIVCAHLKGRGWQTAQQLKQLGYSDRALREIASQSQGAIISGQLGYRLTEEATDEEVKHAVGWLRSQASKMTTRANEIMARKFYGHRR